MKILKSWNINSELKVCHVDEFDSTINDLTRKYFDETYPILRWQSCVDDSELEQMRELNQKLNNRARIDVGLFRGDEIVGWSYGWQGGMERGTYYMANSCVIPEYRRAGYYSLMLEKVIEIAREMKFQTITSRHVVSNNPVIIAKLKAGFHITGMELSEIHGNLIHLSYHLNETRYEAYKVRSGEIRPKSEVVKNLFFNPKE